MIVNCGTWDEPNRDAKTSAFFFAVRLLQKLIGAILDALNPFIGKRLKGKPAYSQQKEWVPFR